MPEPSDPLVRRATLADVPACADLLFDLFGHDLEFTPHRDLQVRGLELIVTNPSVGGILVLELGRAVVGMVSLLSSISTALGGKVAVLEDMVIDEARRGQGFGTRLLGEALRFAQADGYLRVTLLTDHDKADAIRFYESFGFQKSPMIPLRKEF